MYEAFGRGDVGSILDHLADDVEWDVGKRDTGLPYLRERRGIEEVAGFFADLAANLELTRFEPEALCDGGSVVAVPVVHAGRAIGGGEVPPTQEVHLWRFGPDGKVTSFEHILDLAVHERAAAARSEVHEGAVLRAVGDEIRVLRAGGALEIFEVSGPRESGPPPHAHPWDEAYIGVEGEVAVTIGEEQRILRPGDVLAAAAGVLHCYRIVSDGARMHVITSGHRASAFFADLDAHTAPGMSTAESLPGIIEVAKRNGLSSPLFA
jgi:quercetin dioxygenase-like cupin family protein